MSSLRTVVAVVVVLGAAGCAPTADPSAGVRQVAAVPVGCMVGAADSTRAVGVALDTLGRLDRFRSVVYGVRRDSGSFRIVTMPAPEESVLDGMAIVRVGPDCRVVSLVQTDSA
jgi:hypothetical protein